MSSEKGKDEENGGGIGFGSLLLGAAFGGGLVYLLKGSSESQNCNNASTSNSEQRNRPSQGTANQQARAFCNREFVEEDCSICLTKVPGVIILPCTHRFHRSCVLEWFKHRCNDNEELICPTCKAPAPAHLLR